MGSLIALGLLWYWVSSSTPREVRKKERRLLGAALLGSAVWLLGAVVNADKHTEF